MKTTLIILSLVLPSVIATHTQDRHISVYDVCLKDSDCKKYNTWTGIKQNCCEAWKPY